MCVSHTVLNIILFRVPASASCGWVYDGFVEAQYMRIQAQMVIRYRI
jgi:hypothetical protein